MDPVSVFVGYLATQLEESETASKAKDEFFDAAWKWVRPIFLKDEEALVDFKENPKDPVNVKDVESTLAKSVRKDPALESELNIFIEKIHGSKGKVIQIVDQIHSGSGDNIAGDKIMGNKNV